MQFSTVYSLAINSNYIFAGTEFYGVWRLPLSDITGINEIINNENHIAVYPNPTANNLIIESPQDAVVEITNIQGQLIKTLTAKGNKINIDVSAFPKGIYFIHATTQNSIATNKFIKD